MSKLLEHRSLFRMLLLALPILVSSAAQSKAAAEDRYAQAHMTLVQLEPPRQDTLPPPENERCARYAQNAIDDYRTMRQHRECFTPDSPRWQADYRNHYQWCLTAQPGWLASEANARSAHLVRCGVRSNY